MTKKLTKKAFREILNKECGKHVGPIGGNGQNYGNRTRPYGDYLYAQDRGMFNWLYEQELEKLNQSA